MAPMIQRRPLEELSPNKSSLHSSLGSSLKIGKSSLHHGSFNARALSFEEVLPRDVFPNSTRKLNTIARSSWSSEVPSSPPQKSGFEPRLSSPMPLLPRSGNTLSRPVRAETCKEHADRLKVRLRLALYKVATNQEELSFSQIPEPDDFNIQSIAKYSNKSKLSIQPEGLLNTEKLQAQSNNNININGNLQLITGDYVNNTNIIKNTIKNENTADLSADQSVSIMDIDKDNKSFTAKDTEKDDEDSSASAKSFVTPSRRLVGLQRASATVNPNGSTFSSSPVKNHLLGSAVKGTPASMGAARSLLKLGTF